MLHYDRYLAEGFPIATGVIEGACRHLVKDRMDITGARWPLHSSGDTKAYWTFHETEELKRNTL